MRPWSTGRADRRGTTLFEVLICSVLMLLIVGSIYYVMVAGARYFRVTNATIEVQQSSLAALARLTQELAESNARTFAAQPGCIMFASPRDADGRLKFDASSRLLWQKQVSYYQASVNGTPCLVRKEKLLPQAVSAAPPPPPYATVLRDDGSAAPLVVARNITVLESSAANPVELAVTAALNEGGRDFKVRLTSKVMMKN